MPLRTAAVPIRRASSSPLGFNKGISGVPALKLTKSAHGRLATARAAAPSSIVKALPLELIVRLFAFCDAPSTFATVCRTFASIAQDPYARAKWFIARYGPRMAFYQAFKAHRRAFNPEVARCMLLQSAVLPRFVIQYVVREYHQRRSSFGVLGGGNMGLQGGVGQGQDGVGLGGQGQGQGGGVQAAATPSLIATGSTINVYGESLATRNKGYVSAALYAFFVAQGYNLYESDADFKEDDAMRFERLLYGTSSSAHSPNLDAIRDLIVRFKFVPVKGTGSSLDEIVYTVSKLDLSLVDQLFANGLQRTDELNDLVVERVLWRTDITEDSLRAYVNHGFKLTDSAVKKGLQMSRPATVEALRAHVPHETLQKLAEETVVDILGPNTRGWSFTPEAIDYLRQSFVISEDVIERALYVRPPSVYAAKAAATQANGSQLPDVHEFPATRCYFKPNPCSVWRWVLRAYGPDHPFTLACFDDALSRAAGDRDLHALHDIFLDAGVKFRPRHVKILACRVLHRDMASNALHLIKVLRPQLADRFRTVSPTIKDPASPSTPLRYFQYLSDADDTLDPSEWIKALKDEVVENREWVERMRTTQLEGGPRGGVYRVTRPPEEGLKFLEEAREIVGELMGVGGGVGTPSILEWNGRAMRRCLGNGEGSSGDGGSSQAAAAEHEGHNSATTVPTMDDGVEDVGSHEDTEVSVAGSTSRVEEVRMPSLGCSPDPTEEVSADPEPTAAEEQPAVCVEPEPVVPEPASPLLRSLTQQEDTSSVRSRSRHLKGDGASWFGMALGRILRNRFHPKSYTRT